jgi:PAS domain S-box-containing protein
MKPVAQTKPKGAEETLRKCKAEHRRLIENSPDIIYTLSPEGVFVFVSPAWTALLGHPVSQVVGKPFQQFVHPDDVERCLAFLQRMIEPDQRQQGLEYRVRHADGSWRWLATRVVPQKDEAGTIVGYEGVAGDITERKQAEEAPRESEERSRLIYENMRDTLWLMDMSFKTTWISPSVVRNRGFQLEELQASTLDRHMTPASMARLAELTATHLSPVNLADKSREVVFDGEFEFYRKDGTTFWGDTVTTLLRDRDGAPKGFLCVVRDLTDRRRGEAALQVSEARYRRLVENANEAIVVAQDGLLKFVNRMAIEMTGYTEPELTSRPFPEFIHPDDRVKVTENYRKRLAGETVEPRYVFRLRPGSGGVRWVELGAVLIDWEGRPATLNFLTDITDRYQAEETIRASLREKEVMLREIHHRVKNNLQVISSLFSLQAGHVKDAEARRILREGQARVRSMALIHDKLYRSGDLSKIDFGDYLQSLSAHLFQALMADAGRIRLETQLPEVFLDINAAVPCGLLANELITNALEHAFPEGRRGVIRIGLRRLADGGVELCVADDGVGFPEGLDFRRTESLGLQIVNLLVGQLEGTIDLDPEKGTSFTVRFQDSKFAPLI